MGRASARRDNGSVEVAVPPGEESHQVDIASDNGSTTNSIRTDPAGDRTIEARSDGTVTVRYLR